MGDLIEARGESFKLRLAKIDEAFERGDLVTNDLKIVKRNGFRWVWVKCSRALLNLFHSCTHRDPWKAYRLHTVIESLSVFAKNQANYSDGEIEQRLEAIYKKIQTKIVHSSNKKKCEKALNAFSQVLKKGERTDSNGAVRGDENVKIFSNFKEQARVREAITAFSNVLCTRLNSENRSLAFSPISLVAALGMCLQIITPEKKEKFIEKIGLKGLSENEVHEGIAAVLHGMALPKEFTSGKMEVAQGIAAKEKEKVAALVEEVKKNYGADCIFGEPLKDLVNPWVVSKTHGKITSILDDDLAVLVFLNAVYLNFEWESKFIKPKGGWGKEEFLCHDGSKVPVLKMVHKGYYPLYKGEGFSMLEKEYLSPKGRKFSQLIFLPKDGKDLVELEKKLTPDAIRKYRKESKIENVTLRMPKTKGESTLDLLDVLKEFGLPLDDLDPEKVPLGISISKIIQKTFVATNEEGTEASAVTAIICTKSLHDEVETVFDVSHSYAYLIMDGDMVLFQGRVIGPEHLVVD